MKADTMSNRSSSGKKSSKLRCLNLSFEGKELMFKNGHMDNGRLPHGGYKGSKKHPLGLYSWDKDKDYQHKLREDLNHMMDTDGPEANGSPQWALEAHRQPTHSGESPLLINKFLSPSKHESSNGSLRSKANRSLPTSANGVQYYRPNRMHQYLSATELKDSIADNDEALRYGRPTRTTLLRARQRVGPSSNSYELRRQMEHRMDELRNSTTVTTPKEFSQLQSELDGETYHSFLTGARYNRAHCLDSKSLSQYGVYMPRNNPLGCFVIGQRGELLDTTSAPPESPRSDIEQGSSPVTQRRRPTTAPGYGYRRKPQVRIPPSPRQAWGDASCSLHITNGDHKKGEATDSNEGPVIEEIRLWSPLLNVKGSKLPLKIAREGPMRFESKLPSVHGTSLSRRHKQFQEVADDTSDANQPPPSPAGHMTSKDGSHFPAVRQEPETDRRSDQEPEEDVKQEEDSKPVDEVAAKVSSEAEEGIGETTGDTGDTGDAGIEEEQVVEGKIEQAEAQEETQPETEKGEAQPETEKGEAQEETQPETEKGEAQEETQPETEKGEAQEETQPETEKGEAQEETPSESPATQVEREEDEANDAHAEGESENAETREAGAEDAGEEAVITQEAEQQEAEQHENEDTKQEEEEETAASPEAEQPPQEHQDAPTAENKNNNNDDQDQDDTKTTEDTAAAQGDNVKFFLTEDSLVGGAPAAGRTDSGANQEAADSAQAGEEEAGEGQVEKEQGVAGGERAKEDRPSSSAASSVRSKGRRTVTFSEPEEEEGKEDGEGNGVDTNDDANAGQGLENGHDDSLNDNTTTSRKAAGGGAGVPGAESEDTDAEEGQGQTEPLRVIVTHIETGMGAPGAE